MATATATKPTRLTPAQVRKIRKLWENTNLSQREIGERVGRHQVTISQIVRGVTHANVD